MTADLFTVTAQDQSARTGLLRLAHGTVRTPVLMFVGTQGTVKGVLPDQLLALGVQMILSNTYHLYLRPGIEVVREAGGLHRFMAWPRPILTDSGGFQLFSLAQLCEVTDEGVQFLSHVDGSLHRLTPELVVEAQEILGSDIAMVLDHFPGYPCTEEQAREAVRRTLVWAERCKAAHKKPDQALFAIVQGSVWPSLRRMCARELVAMDFPGYAIGGVSVGEQRSEKLQAVEVCCGELPPEKPRYLMGVGEPEEILPAVAAGVDMFDCTIPTRCGRNRRLYTWDGTVNLANAKFRRTFDPVEPGCPCPACRNFSAAYLHHLFSREEILGPILGTLHNIAFFQRLMSECRRAIETASFRAFMEEFLAGFKRPAGNKEA